MKKSNHLIIITVILVIIALIVCIVAEIQKNKHLEVLIEDANNIASNILGLVKEYSINNEDVKKLEEGYEFDLLNQNTKMLLDIDEEYHDKITEGIIYKDTDNSIKIVSNIKINDMYCTYENNVFDCNKKNKIDSNIPEYKNKLYILGDAVTLNDNSKWHVIKDSKEYSNYVTLLYDDVVDVDGYSYDNYEFKDDYEDGIAYDKSNLEIYDVNKEGNIGYYIDKVYKKSLKLEDILDVRLLTENEYDLISNKIDSSSLNTDMLFNEEVMNWFYNHTLRNWWLLDTEIGDGYISTVIWSNGFKEGGFALAKPNTQYYLRPVVTLSKNNIK